MKKTRFILIPLIAIGGTLSCILSYLFTYFAFVSITDAIEYPYTLWHTTDQIKEIEICEYNYEDDTFSLLKSLTPTEEESIVSDLEELTHQKVFGSRPYYGEIVICITYKDASKECIGIWGVGRTEPDGSWSTYTDSFEEAEFSKMLLKYVDEDLLPKKYLEWAAQELPE